MSLEIDSAHIIAMAQSAAITMARHADAGIEPTPAQLDKYAQSRLNSYHKSDQILLDSMLPLTPAQRAAFRKSFPGILKSDWIDAAQSNQPK